MTLLEKDICTYIESAAGETFLKMLNLDLHLKRFEAFEATKSLEEGVDVLSVVGLKSQSYVGSLCLGFPKKTFINVVEKLLGEVVTEITNENSDAAAELLNIIYCTARPKMNAAALNFEPAIPATVIGNNLSIGLHLKEAHFFMRGDSSIGSVQLVLALKKL